MNQAAGNDRGDARPFERHVGSSPKTTRLEPHAFEAARHIRPPPPSGRDAVAREFLSLPSAGTADSPLPIRSRCHEVGVGVVMSSLVPPHIERMPVGVLPPARSIIALSRPLLSFPCGS